MRRVDHDDRSGGAGFDGFGPAALAFLEDLRRHNTRDWFNAHRDRYETTVREPARAFVRAMAPVLADVAPYLRADDRKTGGSLMRIHRDTRFSPDKTPCKTNIGIQFRHVRGRDVHAPGFYVHLEPGQAFLGAGLWRPDAPSRRRIRQRIDEAPRAWRRVRGAAAFTARYALEGDSLRSMPRGFRTDHPLAADLRRTDFIAVHRPALADALGPGLVDLAAASLRDARDFLRFLCTAIGVQG